MTDTLFAKIIAREIPADIIYEDEQCLAFNDIHPKAPFHALVIPKKSIVMLADTSQEDSPLLGHLLSVGTQLAKDAGYADAFRVVINNGAGGGQSVFHLHLHILGGRNVRWAAIE
jgi:histidine triad (HIT) family protein